MKDALNALLRLVGFVRQPFIPEAGCVYPNGSVPYGDDSDPVERAARWACAFANHHPRSYNGSWCMGYGYVCSRCHMYADPLSKVELRSLCDTANQMERDDPDFYLGDLCGGRRRR